MSPIRTQDSLSELGDHSNDEYVYDDYPSVYGDDPDDGDSAMRIEVGSAHFDAHSLIEGPAITGTWATSSASFRTGQTQNSSSSSSQGRRRSRTWSVYSETSSSSNDWRRLLGPAKLSTDSASPEFASTISLADDFIQFTHDHDSPISPTADVDPMSGFDIRYITQDLSSASLPDFVSRPLIHKSQENTQPLEQPKPTRRRSLLRTPSSSRDPSPISPASPTPTNVNKNPFPFPPAVQQLRDPVPSRRQRPLSIQSAQTTGTFALDDSFSKGLMTWGGEGYESSRREWVIKKDREKCQYQNRDQNYQRQDKDKKPVWKGLYPDDNEVWSNYLLGNFFVSREDVSSSSSSRPNYSSHSSGAQSSQSRHSVSSTKEKETSSKDKERGHIQQRLVVRRLRDDQTSSSQPKSSQSPVNVISGGSDTTGEASTSPVVSPSVSATPSFSPSDSNFVVSTSGSASTSISPSTQTPSSTVIPVQHEHERTQSVSSTSQSIPVSRPSTSSATTSTSAASCSAYPVSNLTRIISTGTEESSGSGSGSSDRTTNSSHTNYSANTNHTNSTGSIKSSPTRHTSKGRPKINSDIHHSPVTIHRHSKVMAFSLSRHYRSSRTSFDIARSNSIDPQSDTILAMSKVSGSGQKERERDRVSGDKGGSSGPQTVRRSQVVMLASREVQQQFHDAYSKAKNTKHLLVGAGLAVDGKVVSAKQKEKEREMREREKEKRAAKGKEKERDQEKERQQKKSPQSGAKALSALAKQKSEPPSGSVDIFGSFGFGKSSSPDSGFPVAGSSTSHPHVHGHPFASVGTRSMPEKRTRQFEELGLDLDAPKHTQSLSHLEAGSSLRHREKEEEKDEDHIQTGGQEQPQQRCPARPRHQSFAQPQQLPSSLTHTQQESLSASGQSKSILRRLFRDTSSSSSPVSSRQGTGTATSVTSLGTGSLTSGKSGTSASSVAPSASSVAPSASSVAPSSPTSAARDDDSQVQQRKILDSLEKSFENIGLLPSVHERERDRERLKVERSKMGGDSVVEKKKSKGWLGQRKAVEEDKPTDVLGFVPRDSLFMILPLWPEETDTVSQKMNSFVLPEIPLEERKYLVVYYKSMQQEEETHGKQKGSGKEKESEGRKLKIILTSFLVAALPVSHEELQGIPVSLPKEGLVVSGPLEDAFRAMPSRTSSGFSTNPSVRKCLLARCNSRETGLEFDPEALIQLGLCTIVNEGGEGGVPNPLPLGRVPEEFDAQRSVEVKLTSLGTAVMEMVWCGGLALTSFGSDTDLSRIYK